MGFGNVSLEGRGGMRAPNHNFVVFASVIKKFGAIMKLDVFYTMAAKIVTSLLICNYDAIICILGDT